MAMNGTDILVLIEGVVMGSQRDVTFDETTDAIDVSSKDGRARRVLPGRYASDVTFDALYVPSDTAYQSLKDAMRLGTFVTVRRQESGVALEDAEAIVTSLSDKGPDQAEATVSIGLAIDGDWVEVGT